MPCLAYSSETLTFDLKHKPRTSFHYTDSKKLPQPQFTVSHWSDPSNLHSESRGYEPKLSTWSTGVGKNDRKVQDCNICMGIWRTKNFVSLMDNSTAWVIHIFFYLADSQDGSCSLVTKVSLSRAFRRKRLNKSLYHCCLKEK